MTEQLIQIKPINKTKGFQDLKFKDSEVKQIFSKIIDISQSKKLSEKDNNIIGQVLKSYEKASTGIKLSESDFVLTGHEINEFKSINKTDHARYIIYRYKYNKYPQLKIVDDYPPCIQIEPSSICNYRCIMFYQIDTSFSKKSSGYMGYMDFEMYKNIIDQIEGNVEAVTLASRGEPLLNKDFVRMLEYSSGKFLGFKINTNACRK